MNDADHKLRILGVLNIPWDERLGASRTWIELKREWEKAGHAFEKFCLTDAFPPPKSRAGSAFQQLFFPVKAASYVRRNASRFDVLDCLIGALPYRKKSLGFRGLFVGRSVGLFRLYDRFLRRARNLWPKQSRGRWYGPLLHRFLAWRNTVDSEATLRSCDLVLVPNEDERSELEQGPPLRASIVVEPFALTDEFRDALTGSAAPAAERLTRQLVCFIGMWSPRKGSRDWSNIIAAIRKRYPATAFRFLGTMYEDEVVFADLEAREGIFCRKSFSEAELPSLLSDCTVGLFPSYIEGFGLAVLEQLAAGLPTIAYDVSGPRQILAPLRDRLLVPAGDIAQLTSRTCDIFATSTADYERLSRDCVALSSRYRWSEVAARTIEAYRAHLASLANRPGLV